MEEGNHIAPTFARIFKEMIIVTDPKRPFPRAAKGTIVRKQALALYEEDIENLYARLLCILNKKLIYSFARYQTVDDSTDARGIAPPESWDSSTVEAWLSRHSSALHDGGLVEPTVDLFDQGFDRYALYAMQKYYIILTLCVVCTPHS